MCCYLFLTVSTIKYSMISTMLWSLLLLSYEAGFTTLLFTGEIALHCGGTQCSASLYNISIF